MAIAVVGMIDEREEALGLIKERIEQHGHKALLVDISIGTGAIVPSLKADIECGELSELGGGPSAGVAGYLPRQREEAISIMARGLREKILALHKRGDLQGVIAVTGLTGAMISLPAMKDAPFGLPKIIISSAMALPVHADKYAEFVCVKDREGSVPDLRRNRLLPLQNSVLPIWAPTIYGNFWKGNTRSYRFTRTVSGIWRRWR